jgi:ribosomal protein S18 acetylase RimI-like enzyme
MRGRNGIARALIEELIRVGREHVCSTVWVLTNEDNEAAMGLYSRTGGRWDGTQQVMFEYDLDDS